ncbi:MAG: 3-dehydroquinate synthase, partial [FCB group bacterium]|nr:3-dehydroquinate synthase [FCB group bacterium]
QVEALYKELLRMKCDRSTTILALGGGVVGDVAGFVAATYMRGIDYIQIPTTLLAMVDSSIGGKTGVNLPNGKNLVGSIYQPRAVAVDPHFLKSLPGRELVSGFAEVLKYGAIRDREFFHMLGENMDLLLSLRDDRMLEDAIARSCAIKAAIVSADEREGGMRRILNFGHTIGHALETTTGYNVLRHGEAVAFGMLCAGFISRNMGYLAGNDWEQLRDTIHQLPLPELPPIDPQLILKTIRHDKKVKAGTLHFILLEEIGRAVVSADVTEDYLLESLDLL